MSDFVNIAVYKFVALDNLKQRREKLRALGKEWGLKGTILLSPEGINMFLASSRTAIDRFLETLRQEACFADLEIKESLSDHQPFRRFLVKIKQEIITFSREEIEPANYTSAKLAPQTLKQWLDEGRRVHLLDVRNDYEVKIGTFHGAEPIGIDHFRKFPEAVPELPQDWKAEPVVMFCTGGIRCEKAGPFMEREGFRQVYQLEGGILKYFEECGAAHYDGECFVFDQRVAVDANLQETGAAMCYACQAVLTPTEQQSPHYIVGKSCPYCYQTPEERMHAQLAKRKQKLASVSNPLPGSVPYVNYRPINVPGRCDGMNAFACLQEIYAGHTREEWQELFENHKILRGGVPLVGDEILRAGERLERVLPETVEPEVNAEIEFLYEDESLVVINKPAPLPMHAAGRFSRNTLGYLLDAVYKPERLRAAHRLDANTTGVVVLCRTKAISGIVQPQFARSEVQKRYLARVIGHPQEDRFRCDAAIAANPSHLGARLIDEAGLPAETEFQVLARDADGTSLLEVRPLSGRTNQIRLHLWHLGFPILGDPVYLPESRLGDQQTLALDAPPLCLHAVELTFEHPKHKEQVRFTAEPPSWASQSTVM